MLHRINERKLFMQSISRKNERFFLKTGYNQALVTVSVSFLFKNPI